MDDVSDGHRLSQVTVTVSNRRRLTVITVMPTNTDSLSSEFLSNTVSGYTDLHVVHILSRRTPFHKEEGFGPNTTILGDNIRFWMSCRGAAIMPNSKFAQSRVIRNRKHRATIGRRLTDHDTVREWNLIAEFKRPEGTG